MSKTRAFDLIWSIDPFRVVVVIVGYLQDIAGSEHDDDDIGHLIFGVLEESVQQLGFL